MARVVLASGNPGKLREFSDLLAGKGFELARQSDFGIEPPPETGDTFLANALIKARNAARQSGLPAIADDSGIEVDALDGAPGVYSARYAGEGASDESNLVKLLEALKGVPDSRRGARYRCVIVYLRSPTAAPAVFEGSCPGRILEEPDGTGGFGYDPLFLSAELGKSFGSAI